MDELLQSLNRIQEIFAVLDIKCGKRSFLDLPRIVIIGSQSSGKSSVLESLVGRSFLPCGIGIVTRCPLILQLVFSSQKELARVSAELSIPKLDAWGCFSHRPDRKYTKFDEIRQEIITETHRLAGENNNISASPIFLKIYSNSINLTFVDLPGLINVPVGDQPDDIEQRVRNVTMDYISMANCIILVVVAANTDVTMSEGLRLANQVDPLGKRTLAVITKLDLMDDGTSACDVLGGHVISVPLGIIGVVNHSQREIMRGKSISQVILDEAAFLKLHYPKLAARNGTSFLAKTLQHLLIDKIHMYLPEIRSAVVSMTNHYKSVLKGCGEPIFDKGQAILNIITEYCLIFNSCIRGNSADLDTAELSEGARISYIFQESYGRTMESINPLTGYTKGKILTAMRNASGTCSGLFIPETSFELLVKQQIKQLEEPSLICADLVYQELERVILNTARKCAKDLQRFHLLHRKILDISSDIIRLRLPDTHSTIRQLIAIQMAYINSNHPDFVKDSICIGMLGRPNSDHSCKDPCYGDCGGYPQRKPHYVRVKPAISQNLNANGFSASIGTGVADLTTENKDTVHILDNREQSDCIIIEQLIKCYFNIVRKSIQDTVPKAIMYCLVNYVIDNLQPQLVTQLYHPEQFDELLTESQQIIDKRKDTSDIIKVLDKASDVINEIRDFQTYTSLTRL